MKMRLVALDTFSQALAGIAAQGREAAGQGLG